MNRKNVKGIVLAGGKSSRFGEDKALARLGGVTLLERAIKLLRELNLEPVVITNGRRDYSFLNCQIERDVIPDQGPLGGLYTACQVLKGFSLLVLTCDMPCLTLDSLNVLLENHNPRHSVTLFGISRKRPQPFPGVYKSNLSGLILEKLKAGQYSMQDFLKAVSDVKVVRNSFDPTILININKEEDMNLYKPALRGETLEFYR
ncbi:MAG: molybdenum cofactor guanylyltransferase [Candidatus Omnitrophica bacterium]|nr:molybdenum cofactor guanylyltransferase [Candidatus Omnitrophota bacterium]